MAISSVYDGYGLYEVKEGGSLSECARIQHESIAYAGCYGEAGLLLTTSFYDQSYKVLRLNN